MKYGQANIRYEIHLLIKYIKSVLWRVSKRLSYTEDARCLKFKVVHRKLILFYTVIFVGRDNLAGIATCYGLDGPRIESP